MSLKLKQLEQYMKKEVSMFLIITIIIISIMVVSTLNTFIQGNQWHCYDNNHDNNYPPYHGNYIAHQCYTTAVPCAIKIACSLCLLCL